MPTHIKIMCDEKYGKGNVEAMIICSRWKPCWGHEGQ